MTQTTIDPKNHKDSVFRILFNDPKELLALYNALNGHRFVVLDIVFGLKKHFELLLIDGFLEILDQLDRIKFRLVQ